ncbi:MoxR family ATPase [Sphaerothrix gracilis]|uniref:AAA family ATPase n=1 Tax=Sphaerothrix gracilis TaxID=3151835 RepID=UPI0031FD2AA5
MTTSQDSQDDWQIFKGNDTEPHSGIEKLPPPPSWRPFGKDISPGVSRRKLRGKTFRTRPEEVKMVNAALYLRRPLLITGRPGTGKSSLAYAVAEELGLGEVLYWPITTRTTLKAGLYNYDAIGRLQEVKEIEARGLPPESVGDRQKKAEKIASFTTLGPLGTALLPSERPRVLLIDEIDKSDIDLPNDLLTIFEEGRFEIPELLRLEKDDPDNPETVEPLSVRVRTAYTDDEEITKADQKFTIPGGRITCKEFPLVILTSNGERDFPPPFLRRCLRLNMYEPDRAQLVEIVKKHFENAEGGCDLSEAKIEHWIGEFLAKRNDKEQLATDQLLNALYIVAHGRESLGDDMEEFVKRFLMASLDRALPAKPKDRSPASKNP